MTRSKKRAGNARRRLRTRREEQQLELELAARDERLVSATPDLAGKRRAEAMSDTQSKRLRNGVLVQQFLK